MSLQDLASSPQAMRMGMFLSRHVPQPVAHRFSRLAASLLCRTKPTVYRIVEANLRQVLGGDVNEATLARTSRRVLSMVIRTYYDLYRALQRPHQGLLAAVDLPASSQAIAQGIHGTGRGTVLVFPHLGNFDLGGHALAAYIPAIQLITLPNPPPGFQLANDLRRMSGIEVTPLNSASLRRAIQHLRQGGAVAIAGDRPVSELEEPVLFFGRPARIPSAPVRLALKTDAQIVVVYCVIHPETQRDTLYLEPPMDLVRTGKRDEEVSMNMRRVLDRLESIIRCWADQWLMFVPVWPGVQGM